MAEPCRRLGNTLATPRIYLTGRVTLEYGERVATERDMPGRQGRTAFVFLAAHRHRPVSRGELVDVIWPDGPPQDTDTALNAILSKLRATMKKAGWPPDGTIAAQSGSVAIRLPATTRIDLEEAANAIDEAEGALRAGDAARAWGCANVVVSVARRPFLPDAEAPWIESRRSALRTLLIRGLECLAHTSETSGDTSLAVQYWTEILELEPFRETAYRRLMRLHVAMGNRAEALRVFERCRTLLRDELGVGPAHQTESLFLEILRANTSTEPGLGGVSAP
jgi:DNA-binding SARP family transcriptional activator